MKVLNRSWQTMVLLNWSISLRECTPTCYYLLIILVYLTSADFTRLVKGRVHIPKMDYVFLISNIHLSDMTQNKQHWKRSGKCTLPILRSLTPLLSSNVRWINWAKQLTHAAEAYGQQKDGVIKFKDADNVPSPK